MRGGNDFGHFSSNNVRADGSSSMLHTLHRGLGEENVSGNVLRGPKSVIFVSQYVINGRTPFVILGSGVEKSGKHQTPFLEP